VFRRRFLVVGGGGELRRRCGAGHELFQLLFETDKVEERVTLCSPGSRRRHGGTVPLLRRTTDQQPTPIPRNITHSLFRSRLKTFLFRKSFPLQPFISSS